MGGGGNIGEESDNPVEINVTAMVDVIFCLCIFFMCSFHFKQLEGKIDTWLPKDRGVFQGQPEKVILEEIRVFMKWDPANGRTIRKVGNRGEVNTDEDLMNIVIQMTNDYKKAGKSEFPVLIDATPDVPWQDVIHVMDMCKKEKLERIEFAAPFWATKNFRLFLIVGIMGLAVMAVMVFQIGPALNQRAVREKKVDPNAFVPKPVVPGEAREIKYEG